MTPLGGVAIVAAGMAAGAVNTIAGSGSLITFPTLLALGYPPVLANVSNAVGLVPGSVSGAYGYRRELAGQRSRCVRYGLASSLGALLGAVLLIVLPAKAFEVVVPFLILVACGLIALQPRLQRLTAARGSMREHGGPLLWFGIFLTGIYGGYFGAAQGVILIALLGILVSDSLQRLNALKNVLAALVNGVAGIVFVVISHVAWGAAGLIAAGAIVGGQLGALVGRRLDPRILRWAIVVLGLIVSIKLLSAL